MWTSLSYEKIYWSGICYIRVHWTCISDNIHPRQQISFVNRCTFYVFLTVIWLEFTFMMHSQFQFNSQNLCNTSASPPVVFKIQYRTNVTLDDGNYVVRLLHKPVMNLYINEQITTSFGISDPPPYIILF